MEMEEFEKRAGVCDPLLDMPPARFGKPVHVRGEHHGPISWIVHVMEEREISLSGLIDSVPTLHFEKYRDGITQSFKDKTGFKQAA
ncbi:MAG: DUF3408 domain-containing protein [Tannerella sp.]|jgi:hypothetical protein|nr:DUF3408 domain-containing protein [Tannerella sp.]